MQSYICMSKFKIFNLIIYQHFIYWNWLEVICTQVMCDDMSDRMYTVYVLRSKLSTYFCMGCIHLILHGEYMPVAEVYIKVQ